MTQSPVIESQEHRLRRDLGFTGLTAIGFSNIVGSGWLFAAMYAAQIAGPAAILSWIAAGILCALIALVMVELGATGRRAAAPCAGRSTPTAGSSAR
jgi:amino acid transporter